MKISEISIKRPVTTIMAVFIVIILGFVSLSRLNIDLLPDINLPFAVVITDYRSAGPKEVEINITNHLENILASVSNVKNINSISSEGNSLIILEFNQGTNMDFAALDMREKIDIVENMLPDGAGNPLVLKLNPNMLPIMTFAISHKTKDPSELKLWAENILKPRIERIAGVASVNISGGTEKEIKVIVDPYKLSVNGLSVNLILNALRMENINAPGGIITEGKYDLIVRTTGEFNNIDEIRNLPIISRKGVYFKLKDIAEVKEDVKKNNIYSKVNGEDSLTLSIQKESTANTSKTAARVKQEIERLNDTYTDMSIISILDQSKFVNYAISSVKKSAVIGGILAVLILLLFLKDIRPTIVIALSIPISIIATFILIYFSDITLNMISLGGLALGVGMLVDNSIVVLENIYRMKKEGLSNIEAAKQGSSEISMAITASTLTTISVFLPVVFVEGITAEIFKQMALTVTFSLVTSLIVALTLVPMLSSKFLGSRKKAVNNKIMDSLKLTYSKLLHWSLRHRIIVLLLTLIAFSISLFSIKIIGTEYFPITDEGQISIEVEMPKGIRYEETVKVIKQVEKIVSKIPEIETIYSNIGSSQRFEFKSSNSSKGTIDLILKDLKDRTKSDIEIADKIRNLTSDISGCEIKVTTMGTMLTGPGGNLSPIAIDLSGDDFDILNRISNDVISIVKKVRGTRDVRSNFEKGAPELKIFLNRDKALKYGITTAIISSEVKSQLQGITATRYRTDGKEIDISIHTDIINKDVSADDIKNILISSPLGISVPLSSIARLEYDESLFKINRKNQSRVITVSSSIINRSVGKITFDIKNKLKNYELPEGYSIEFSGESKQIEDAFSSLKLALILGVLLVYMVMASQFESLFYPFIIMFAVPLAFTGAFIGLLVTKLSLSVPAYLGLIVLTGVIVNNGIVLIDYINRLRNSGIERNKAILNAGPTRLQPILMTTLTTVLALFPSTLGIGEGAELEQPLAVSVVGGLLFATILTLIIIPVIYTLFDDLGKKLRRKNV